MKISAQDAAWRAFRESIEPEVAAARPKSGTTVCAAREPFKSRRYGKSLGARPAKRKW